MTRWRDRAIGLALGALLAFPAAALTPKSHTIIPTPAGVLDLRFPDGDDGGGDPPTAPQLGVPIATSHTTADIPLDVEATGGTPPYTYELSLSTVNCSTGFAVFDASADFGADGVYEATGLTPETDYCAQLVAIDSDTPALRSVASTAQAFTTPADPGSLDVTAPTNPTSVVLSSTVEGVVNISWSGATDNVAVTQYQITRGNGDGNGNPTGTSSVIATLTGPTFATSYIDTGLTPGAEVYYRIKSFDAAGNAPASGTSRQFIDVFDGPEVPAALWFEPMSSATWYTNLGWGTATDPNASPLSGGGSMTRVCTTDSGVTPRNGGCMLRIRIPSGQKVGSQAGVHIVREIGHTTPLGGTLYFGYWQAFGNNWNPVVDSTPPGYLTKTPGPSARRPGCGAGGYLCVGPGSPGLDPDSQTCTAGSGRCGWSIRQQSMGQNNNCDVTGKVPVGHYAYYGNDPTPEGHTVAYNGYGYNTGCTQGFQEGTWYYVVLRVKLNTSGQQNGEFEVKVNCTSVVSETGWLYSADGTDAHSIDMWWFDTFTGGGQTTAGNAPNNMDVYYSGMGIYTTEPDCTGAGV